MEDKKALKEITLDLVDGTLQDNPFEILLPDSYKELAVNNFLGIDTEKLTNNNRQISYINLVIDDHSFTVTKAVVKESLDDIFSAECEGYCESMENFLLQSFNKTNSNDGAKAHKFLDRQAVLTFKKISQTSTGRVNLGNKGDEKTTYKGIISQVTYIGTSNSNGASNVNSIKQKYFFKFTLSSPLFRLSINIANRIFTDKTYIEAIKEIFKFHQASLFKELDFSNIKNSYEAKEYIAQYNESDLAFIQRICFNNGIYFYEDDTKIYFYDVYGISEAQASDTTSKNSASAKEINFNPNINNVLNQECIKSINKIETLNTNSFSYSLQNTTYPTSLNFLNSKQNNDKSNSYTAHLHLGQYSFTQQESLRIPAELRKLRSTLSLDTYTADSNVFGLKLNENISINADSSSIKSDDTKFDFKIISIVQTFIDETNLENRLDTNDIIPLSQKNFSTSYSNVLTVLPASTLYVPNFRQKPTPPEATFGVVIGDGSIDDAKNTIHTDEYGRVKVRINAFASQESVDNTQISDENNTSANSYSHSAYLRVMMPIASNGSGFFAVPRIGDEVVVSFLESDIDKPIVSASLYNAYNPPLSNLPNNYHQTTLSSKTVGTDENGRNEITLSNIKDKEQIYLKAEKDYDELVQHNFTQTIQNDKSSKVVGTYTERIKQAHIQTIDLAKNVNVGAEYLTVVGLSKDTMVGLSHTLNVGASNKLRVIKDHSEYIGEDKTVEIKGNLNTTVYKDENHTVKQSKKDTIEGSYEFNSSKGINYYSEEHLTFQADNNIDIKSKNNINIGTDAQHTETAESKFSEIKSDYEINAGNQIIHQVGSTQILINGSSIIIKAGGVETVIDSRGITVKGGEVKAE
ncbi:MAG: type VI secretion system tip protein VgrG [Campylobacter sp.]|nr:type VI secretion system tip protein VgrG [Campylobacter sp.]